jgi:hypothetical protein
MVTNIRIGWRQKGKRRKSFQKSEKYLARFEKNSAGFARAAPSLIPNSQILSRICLR